MRSLSCPSRSALASAERAAESSIGRGLTTPAARVNEILDAEREVLTARLRVYANNAEYRANIDGSNPDYQEYVTTARAKGLPERDVIYKHAQPNAMLPVVTLAGFTVVGLMGGVIITETVFNYPGIGAAAAEASAQLDVITVLGFALFNGFILIVANLVVDVLYGVVDPRVRLS